MIEILCNPIKKIISELTHSIMADNLTSIEEEQFLMAIDKYAEAFFHKAQKYAYQHSLKIRHKARDYVDTFDQIATIRSAKHRTDHWFVTLNPKPDVKIEELHNTIVKVLTQPDVHDPLWSYEIRQSPDVGLHAHLYFRCGNTDNNFCQRKIKAPFVPHLCGTMKHVHIKWVSAEEVPAVHSYIKKETASKKKTPADKATKTWRLENEIPSSLDEDHLLVWSELTPTVNSQLPAILPQDTEELDNII